LADAKSELSQEMKGISDDIAKTETYKNNSAADAAQLALIQ
jgi:hypothetical protein